ncbi:hypothetical protein [Trinickia acidisoli]|uniref:hypothetical protein n=1 Tax=Trinickia acidisoli TaxID=2767482 RepID=UPI001A90C25E|nr:hypothetical protein [Trinickia acidisoli]
MDVVKKSIPLTLFVNAVSVAIAYGFYEMTFHVSLLPFWLTTAMSILAVLGPGIIVLVDGGQSRLVALGLANLFMVTAFYFFCGVVPFFFYFLFAPMPPYMHAGGLALGIVMTGHWMIFTARDVNKALATSRFVQDAFEDTGSALLYRLQNIAKLEAVLSSRSPSGKLHMYLVLLIAPLSLVIGRILSPVFGVHGPVLLSALILFPVSQWIAGIATRQYIAMVRLPRMLERTQGKPVIVVSDES